MPRTLDALDSWKTLPIKQQPEYHDAAAVAEVAAELGALPPLVFAGEVDTLKARLADAASGRAFLLQGGDCAETFAGATASPRRPGVRRSSCRAATAPRPSRAPPRTRSERV